MICICILNQNIYLLAVNENVCSPSPCGPNSQCRDVNGQAVCSCLPSYIGSPPGCRPECIASTECSSNMACENQKCVDPCPNPCGIGTNCNVVNHSPICTCMQGYTGNPFTSCSPIPRKILLLTVFLFYFVFLINCFSHLFINN